MTYQVSIQPNGYCFPIEEHETILDAALKHGYLLPYSCREGVCGVCKGKVSAGSVDHGNYLGSALTGMDRDHGMTLFCCARPESDLVVECHAASVHYDVAARVMPCRVNRMTRMTDDVMTLQLELPVGEHLRYVAGQHIAMLYRDQTPQNFALANAPHDSGFLELHVCRSEDDGFARHVFNGMKEREILRLKGPLGKLRMREDSDKPVVFIADGGGFAPVKAMVEHAMHSAKRRSLHFYWGVHKPSDLYLLKKIAQWEIRGLRFTPVIAEALPASQWNGRTGQAHQAVLHDFADLSGHEVYASGKPAMVDAARRDFIAQRGLPDESFIAGVIPAMSALSSPFQTYGSPF